MRAGAAGSNARRRRRPADRADGQTASACRRLIPPDAIGKRHAAWISAGSGSSAWKRRRAGGLAGRHLLYGQLAVGVARSVGGASYRSDVKIEDVPRSPAVISHVVSLVRPSDFSTLCASHSHCQTVFPESSFKHLMFRRYPV